MKFLPRDDTFFQLFGQHTSIVCDASELLLKGLQSGYAGMCEISSEMKMLERQGDEIVHQIIQRLRKTFLTPFDPEDIQGLSTALDNVLDFIENATFRIVAYRLDPIPHEAVELGRMVNDCCQSLAKALRALIERRSVIDDCIEVNRLENEADILERRLVSNLFSQERDPIALLKCKEIFEVLEATTDRCEDVANVLESVSIKNS
jgi:predicted phosphate transport protein (TIGR00153 family)